MATSHPFLLEAPISKPRILGMFEWYRVVVMGVYQAPIHSKPHGLKNIQNLSPTGVVSQIRQPLLRKLSNIPYIVGNHPSQTDF